MLMLRWWKKRPSWLAGPSCVVQALTIRSMASHCRSFMRTGFEFAGSTSYGTPRTKPHSSRPLERMSTIAISSAIRTGWRRLATGLPRMRSRALVVSVEHDLHALVFGHQPFLDVAVVERGALLRIVEAVGQRDADRLVVVGRRQIRIGVLAEVPGFHGVAPG